MRLIKNASYASREAVFAISGHTTIPAVDGHVFLPLPGGEDLSRICELFPKDLKFVFTCISRGRLGSRITVDSGLPPKICLLPKMHINSTIAGNWIGRHWKKDSRESRTKRRGVDVIEFRDGKIIQKLTCSKTTVEVDGAKTRLSPVDSRK